MVVTCLQMDGDATFYTFIIKTCLLYTSHWEGEGVNEKGIDTATGKVLVEVDPKYFRPAEVEQLLGDPTKAKTLLGWNPRKTSFEELVKIMVKHDMKFVKKLHLKASC